MHSLIIANGGLPQIEYVKALVKFAKLIVCADGGANYARELGIKPNVIIGDFDSILQETKIFFHDVLQIKNEDTNSTDLEKAIAYCTEQKSTSVDIIGALGKRTDHTLSSLGCFKKFGTQIHIRMIDTEGELTLIQKNITLNTHKGEKISIIPIDRCIGVTTKNLKFPLNNEVLELGVREGISNEAVSEQVSISIENGTLLLYRFHGSAWQSTH
jgi:thiamine pyrophosphokinase